MALKTRVWSAGKLLLLGGALLLTYVLFAAASMRVALRTREVVVPSLAGKTVNDATVLLAESGLKLRLEEGLRVDPKVPAGQILSQEPQAGISTRRERSVKVWVSSGPRSTIVPALLGESERTGQMRLQQEGLELSATAVIRSSDTRPTSSSPRRRRRRATAPRVAVLVNRAERGATYVMPDLIGVNGDRAADLLRVRALPRGGRRRSSVSRRPGGHRPPPEPAGRIPDCARRADFARGQPMSVLDRAVDPVGRLRRARDRNRRRRARRRRPHSRRRHGRPLRARI